MKGKRTALAGLALLPGFLLFVASPAQAQVGGIDVHVVDESGHPLPGATVTLSHETGFVKTTSDQTNKQGTVAFPVLRPGPGYSVLITFPGFSAIRHDGIRVKIGETGMVRVAMFEGLEEQVRVTGQREVIDLDKSRTSTKFSDDFIADLPVAGRFYQNLLTLAPGVQDSDGDGNPNVHGSRSRDFQAIVGGVSNVDPLTGQWMSRVNPNSIEELEIITAGAGVEFGRAQGGFARIIQKQGSNRHEGMVEFYWQTSRLDGDGAGSQTSLETPEFETLQPLFQVSGPIVRDRLWYRASYERRDREEPINLATEFGVYSNDTETQDFQVTWQVSPRNKLALQYRSDPATENNFGISSAIPTEASRRRDRAVETYTLTWTAPYSPRVLLDSTLAWQDLNLSESPAQPGVDNACVVNASQPFLQSAQCANLANGRISGSYFKNESDHRQRLTVKNQTTAYLGRFLGAEHRLKAGISIENERYFRELSRAPTIAYTEITVPPDDLTTPAEEFGIAVTRLAIPQSDDVNATGTNWALYLEDQIKPLSNLTITAGLRIDREELNSEGREALDAAGELDAFEADPESSNFDTIGFAWPRHFTAYEAFDAFEEQMQALLCRDVSPDTIGNCFIDVSESILDQQQRELQKLRRAESINLTNTNVSPFLSLAWSPFSDGKTAIKVAAGRHYNNIPLIVPLQELEPVLTDLEYRVSLTTFQSQIFGGIKPKFNLTTVDHDLDTPYQDEFTFSIERELWPETSIQLTYVNRKFRDQLQDLNINTAIGDEGRCRKPNTLFRSAVWPSFGSGQTITDVWTGEQYVDTDPGRGDGRVDDCTGFTEFRDINPETGQFGEDVVRVGRPDGFLDLYTQNPFWGDIFEVGNHNEIEYEAFVLELVRRQYRSWQMNASYTWSEAIGDGEDFFQELGNDPGLRPAVRGYQSYDQRHVVKLNAVTTTPWGIRLGTAVSWQSGLPYSVLLARPSTDTVPWSTIWFAETGLRTRQFYPTGVRNDQRNSSYWNVDLKATRELRLARGVNLQLSAEIFNLLDDGTYLVYNPFFEAGQQLNGTNEASPRFGRRWQLGLRLAF